MRFTFDTRRKHRQILSFVVLKYVMYAKENLKSNRRNSDRLCPCSILTLLFPTWRSARWSILSTLSTRRSTWRSIWGPSGPPCPLGGPCSAFVLRNEESRTCSIVEHIAFEHTDTSHHFIDRLLECLRFECGHSRVERNQFGVGNAAFLDLLEQCANMSQFFLENTNVFLQLGDSETRSSETSPDFLLASTIN